MPRTMPRFERDWLSCTNSPRMPSSSKIERRKVSTKNPRSSPITFGSMSATPSIRVSKSFIGRARLAAGRSEGREVLVEVGDQARVDARRAVELGLAPPPHAHAVVQVGRVGELVELPEQEVRRADLDVVEALLEPVGRRQRLGEHEVPGGEVQADAVLEAQVLLV